MVDELRNYLENTSKDKIQKYWANSAYVDDNTHLGEKIIEYAKQYEGTSKYNDILIAIQFGYQLAQTEMYPVSSDCEEVKNWDSFVEQKNKELQITQHEISDHEIKKGIKRVWNYTDYERRHWMEQGAIWYREQLNLRK